jgi:single-strand DNA-binding protein
MALERVFDERRLRGSFKPKQKYETKKETFTMLNKIMLMGRLTADPILRYTNTSQIPVASFAVAVDRRIFKDRAKETDFFNVVAWQATGEHVTRNFVKGQPICIEGRLQQRQYQDPKTGETRYVVEVIAESVHFAGFKRDDARNNVAEHPADFDPFAGQAAA